MSHHLSLANCDFESIDQCGYINDPNNLIDWQRLQAGFDPAAPTTDVSYASSHGHFMFLKGNSSAPALNSRLFSPTFTDTAGSCIRWYMVLSNKATLRVRTYALGSLNPTILYTIQGYHGKDWKLAQVTTRSGSPYQVVFEGILNNTDTELDTVSIDDVEVRSGVCDDLGTCDFEKGLCGFQLMKADFQWKRTSYNIELFSAPQLDHTTGTRAGIYKKENK